MRKKVKLLVDVPIAQKHGMTKGRVLGVTDKPNSKYVWVKGDAGENVKLFNYEFEFVSDTEATAQ